MQPRPDIGWQAVAIDAHVRGPFRSPDATGRLHIDALTAGRRSASTGSPPTSPATRGSFGWTAR